MASELVIMVRSASASSVEPPEVAPIGHQWFRLDNAEEYKRLSRQLPFILAHGWSAQVNSYTAEMRRIVKADVCERVAGDLAAFLVETFGYRSRLTPVPTPRPGGNAFAFDQMALDLIDRYASLIPPDALERLERIETWLIEEGIRPAEREFVKPLVWTASRSGFDLVVCVSFGQWLVSAYGTVPEPGPA